MADLDADVSRAVGQMTRDFITRRRPHGNTWRRREMPNIRHSKITRKSKPGICQSCLKPIVWKLYFGERVPYNKDDGKHHLSTCLFVSERRRRIEESGEWIINGK